MKTLDIIECAEFLKIERTYALKLAGEGVLPGAKIGRSWVFLEEDLVEYLRLQVRLQQRQRAVELEVESGLSLAAPRQLPKSPLAGRHKIKAPRPNLDLYDLPQPAGQVAAA